MTEKTEVENWLAKINKAEKIYNDYYNIVDETRAFYKDSHHNRSGKYNIFWSSIETLKPFLYFKQPQFYIERQNKSANKIERTACTILERALAWNLSQFDFDSIIKYARNDFLISGTGIIWEQYKPEFIEVANPANPLENMQLKSDEKVESIYVDPKNFIADCSQAGVWEEVDWIARKIYMSGEEAIATFGEDKIKSSGEVCIYEIWDKSSRRVYWLSKLCRDKFLKISDDVLGVQNFFPCPKPIWATQTNDSLIPMPDYCLIKEMLSELNGINARMKMTMQAIKVSGAYDNSFPELADILSKDITLVSVSDFSKLREAGGIRGIIDFVPLEQYVTALEQLSRRRQDVISALYEITGVSDIMRGNSNSGETATAVIKKTNFGTLRNQDRQNDMQRFIRELLRIKAEIICEYFSADKLLSFLPVDMQYDDQTAKAAVELLKTEKLRGMMFSVETCNVLNQNDENTAVLSAVEAISRMTQEAMLTVSNQPKLLPLYRSMVEAVVATMPKARCFETVIENVFNGIEQELLSPPPRVEKNKELSPEQIIELQKNMLKNKELDVKAQIEADKIAQADRELVADMKIKTIKLANENQEPRL